MAKRKLPKPEDAAPELPAVKSVKRPAKNKMIDAPHGDKWLHTENPALWEGDILADE